MPDVSSRGTVDREANTRVRVGRSSVSSPPSINQQITLPSLSRRLELVQLASITQLREQPNLAQSVDHLRPVAQRAATSKSPSLKPELLNFPD